MENSRDQQREKEQQGCKIFIGGLTSDTTKKMLEDYYGYWGETIDAVVMVDNVTKESRGFGFVTFTTSDSVDACMKSAPHKIDSKTVETKRAIPRDDCTPQALSKTKKVFLGGLHVDTTEDDLKEELNHFGEIESTSVIRDKDSNNSRGFGFVVFIDFDSADKLCSARHINIHGRDVEVKKAQSIEEMGKRNAPYRHSPVQSMRGPPPPQRDRYMPSSHPQPSPYAAYQPSHPPRYDDYPAHYHQHQNYSSGYDSYGQSPYRQHYEPTGYSNVASVYGGYNTVSTPGYSSGGGGAAYQGYGGNGASIGGGGIPPPSGSMGGPSYVTRNQGGSSARNYHPYRRQCHFLAGRVKDRRREKDRIY